MGTCVSKIREDLYVRRFAPDHDQHSFTLSRQIERQLRNQEQEDRNMIKLLLLGSGNSGKSTVMKQFKIIHKRGFTTEERRVFRDALWKSAIEGMRALVRSRLDYIAAAHLGDDFDWDGEEGTNRERDLVDPSMEPYFQFLLFRVRPDQPLCEEVIIPVAAEQSPRAEYMSPPKAEMKHLPPNAQPAGSTASVTGVASDGGVISPLLTSTTIVLSSPPVTERKNPLDEMDSESSLSESHMLPPAALSPKSSLDGETKYRSMKGEHLNGVDSLKKIDEDAVPKKKRNGTKIPVREAPLDCPPSITEEKLLTPTEESSSEVKEEKDGTNHALDEAPMNGLMNGHHEPELDKATPNQSPNASPTTSPNASLDEEDESVNEVKPTHEEEEKQSEDATKKKSSKRTFANAEEEAAYLAKVERRNRRKKKKKEKTKRKLQTDESSQLERSTDPAKKMISASSVESFRSESNTAQKVTAPMVTWEKMTVGRLLQKIWMDPLIQRAWAMEDKSPQLEAPLGYIMNAMDRIGEEGFQPTNEDILFARKRTSGVNLLDFEAYGAKFLLIDVGGQRTERKKWLAHFDIVDAVIFVVGLDQYDQTMMEDGVTNRLRDSLELFEEMCSSPWFRNSSFLLFLNKSDVFKTKIKQVPLNVCFRGYQGDPHDFDQTSRYIIKRFQQIHTTHANNYRDAQTNRTRRGAGHRATPHVYPYLTNATDTESMRFVIDTCQDILLRSEMAQWGFFDF